MRIIKDSRNMSTFSNVVGWMYHPVCVTSLCFPPPSFTRSSWVFSPPTRIAWHTCVRQRRGATENSHRVGRRVIKHCDQLVVRIAQLEHLYHQPALVLQPEGVPGVSIPQYVQCEAVTN